MIIDWLDASVQSRDDYDDVATFTATTGNIIDDLTSSHNAYTFSNRRSST